MDLQTAEDATAWPGRPDGERQAHGADHVGRAVGKPPETVGGRLGGLG